MNPKNLKKNTGTFILKKKSSANSALRLYPISGGDMSRLNLARHWVKIDWTQVSENDLSSLPEPYETVLIAVKSDTDTGFRTTKGYWNLTFFDDVCFTIDCLTHKGFSEYASRNVVAWEPLETTSTGENE